jgi:hypothetical protein
MAKVPKFCPDCGNELGGQSVCEKCGFDTKVKTNETNKMSNQQSGGSKSTWDTLEPIISVVGKWTWVWGLIYSLMYIIWAIVLFAQIASWGIFWTGAGVGTAIWYLIGAVVSAAASLLWVKPKFSVPCGEKDWETLLTNVWKVGGVQIPWMLIMGVLLEIFGIGWGGVPVLVCALLIIFLGPRKYEWKVQ